MKNKIIPYNPKLKKLARELRKNMTLSEILLWKKIKQKQVLGLILTDNGPSTNISLIFIAKNLGWQLK